MTGGGALPGTRTAVVFAPKVPTPEPKKAIPPAALVKPLFGASNKSKKDSRAGVTVPTDEDNVRDTAQMDISDSWRQVSSKLKKISYQPSFFYF